MDLARDDFYEEDEDIEVVREILQRPADGVTAPPVPRNRYLSGTYPGYPFVVSKTVAEGATETDLRPAGSAA